MKPALATGYSLAELLVVIAIIVVLGAVFIPGLDSLRSRPTLVSTITKLEDLIITARNSANSTNNVSTMVQFDGFGGVALYQVDQQIDVCPGGFAWGTPEVSLRLDGLLIGGAGMARELCFAAGGELLSSGLGTPIRYEISRGADEYAYRLTVWPRSSSLQREQRENQGAPWTLMP